MASAPDPGAVGARRLALAGALVSALIGAALVQAPRSASPLPHASPPEPSVDLAPLRAELLEAEGPLGQRTSIEDPSGVALERTHAALLGAARGQRQARLLFYGGSHTASDVYLGRMRELLQATFGDAGCGYVNLAPVVRDQWRWGMRIAPAEGWEVLQVGRKRREVERYGLAGAAFLTDERDAFAAISSDSWASGRFASHLELHYERVPAGGTFDVWVDGRRLETIEARTAPDQEPAYVSERLEFDVNDGPHELRVVARGDGPVLAYGVVFERETPGVLVDNVGLVGSKARHHLLWDRPSWRRYFVSRRPDLVGVAYGNNETTDTHLSVAEHEAHLEEMIDRLEEAAPDADCLLIGPTDRPRVGADGSLEPRTAVADLTEMQRRVAFRRGCGFFDTLAFQGGLGAGIVWLEHDPPYMRPDRLHLSREGYQRWGEELTRALLEGLDAP